MNSKVTKYQEIFVILELIKKADNDGSVNYDTLDFDSIIDNGNTLEGLLYDLNEANIIDFEMIREDGFRPIILTGINGNTHEYLLGLILELENERASLESRITEILTFNPNLLSKNVNETKNKLDEVDNLIKNNELLAPMTKPIRDIRRHFESVSVVASNYEDIYKNIIRPVQEEGRSGVRETVKWAIISIIASTAISLVLNNWEQFNFRINSAEQTNSLSKVSNSHDPD